MVKKTEMQPRHWALLWTGRHGRTFVVHPLIQTQILCPFGSALWSCPHHGQQNGWSMTRIRWRCVGPGGSWQPVEATDASVPSTGKSKSFSKIKPAAPRQTEIHEYIIVQSQYLNKYKEYNMLRSTVKSIWVKLVTSRF